MTPSDVADVHALARDLVATPSHEDETACGDRIEDWLRDETDAAVTRDAHGNVLATRGGEGGDAESGADVGEETLAFVGHHDVVPPADAQVEADGGYVVEERDGRLYGRGSADMKGSVAAAMAAFRDASLEGPLAFASFVGEEVGGDGARAAIADGYVPGYAVVAEGSTGYGDTAASGPVTDVAVAHRGRRASTLVARGSAAHASEPDEGVNAIYRACDAVDAVRALDAPTATVLGHEATGSVVVTEVEGGSAWNVVPDSCTLTIDERTVPGDRADLGSVADLPGVEWTVDQDLPPMACGDAAFADGVLDAARAGQEGEPRAFVKPQATDGGWLADAGTACVVVGAAEPGQAHTEDESVSLDVLDRCYRIYKRLAETPLPA